MSSLAIDYKVTTVYLSEWRKITKSSLYFTIWNPVDGCSWSRFCSRHLGLLQLHVLKNRITMIHRLAYRLCSDFRILGHDCVTLNACSRSPAVVLKSLKEKIISRARPTLNLPCISPQNSVTCNGEYRRPFIKAQPSFHDVEVDGGYVEYLSK